VAGTIRWPRTTFKHFALRSVGLRELFAPDELGLLAGLLDSE
jgi:hypothetical protein